MVISITHVQLYNHYSLEILAGGEEIKCQTNNIITIACLAT